MQSDQVAALEAAPREALSGSRLLLTRVVLTAWGLAFAAANVFFGVTLVLYIGGPGTGIGPCGTMGLLIAFFVLVCTGAPWVPAYLQYRQYRKARGTSGGTQRAGNEGAP